MEGTLDVEIEAKTVRLKPKEILLVSPEKIIKSKIFLTTLNFLVIRTPISNDETKIYSKQDK